MQCNAFKSGLKSFTLAACMRSRASLGVSCLGSVFSDS